MDKSRDLVVDDAGIRVVNSAMSTNEQLRDLCYGADTTLKQDAELGVRIDDVGNTLGWIETSDLDNKDALGPYELVHLIFGAQAAGLTKIELRNPRN